MEEEVDSYALAIRGQHRLPLSGYPLSLLVIGLEGVALTILSPLPISLLHLLTAWKYRE